MYFVEVVHAYLTAVLIKSGFPLSMLTYHPQEYVKHMCLDMDLSLRTSFSIFALVISIPFIHF